MALPEPPDLRFEAIHEDAATLGPYWIERGPALCTAIATRDLLTSRTLASHYRFGMLDALGKPITSGQRFSFLDWKSPRETMPWYCYLRREGRYDEIGVMPTRGEAEAFVRAHSKQKEQ